MHDPIFTLTKARKPSIVAVIASLGDFDDISSMSSRSFDLCELRFDKLLPASDNLSSRVRELPFPKIATVRDPLEGGANSIPELTRLSLFERWIPVRNFIDVELRARLGSYLAYGSVGAAVVPGQWAVTQLSNLLSEVW